MIARQSHVRKMTPTEIHDYVKKRDKRVTYCTHENKHKEKEHGSVLTIKTS